MFAAPIAPTSFDQHFYTRHAHAQSRPPVPSPNVFASAGYLARKRPYFQEEEDENEDDNDDDEKEIHEQGPRFKRPRKDDFESPSPLANAHSHVTLSNDNSFQLAQTPSSSPEPLTTSHAPASGPRIVDLSSGEVLEALTSADLSSSPDTSENDEGLPSDTDPTILTRTYNLAKRVRDRFDEFGCISDIWRRDDCAGMRFKGNMTYDEARCAKRSRTEPSTEDMSVVKVVPSGSWPPCDVYRGTLNYTCRFAKGVAAAFYPSVRGNEPVETCQDLVLYRAPSNRFEVEMDDARLVELEGQEADKKEAVKEDLREDSEEGGFDAMDLD